MGQFRARARQVGHRLLIGGGLMLASIALCLLVLEIGLRIWDGIPVFSTVNFVALEVDSIHKPNQAGAEYDPYVGWVQRPNVSVAGFTTGPYGVRMPSSKAVPLQQNATLVVGDSFAMGADVKDDESWPAILEQRIGTQVINAGVGGYGFDQIVLRAEMLVPVFKPRLLLLQARLEYGISVNRMSVAAGAPKPYFTVNNGVLVIHNEPVPRLASSVRDIGWERAVFGHSYLVQYVMTRLNLLQWWVNTMRIKWEISNSESVEVSCLLMNRLAKLRDQNNLRLILVVQYSGYEGAAKELSWEPDRARVLACAKHEALEVIDTLDALRSVYQSGDLDAYRRLWLMSDNNRIYGHPSAEGNRLIANLVAQKLAPSQAAASEH